MSLANFGNAADDMEKMQLRKRPAFAANLGAVSALAALLAAPLPAQESAPEAGTRFDSEAGAPRVVEEVVARGRRLDEIEFDLRVYIKDFLDEVAAPAHGRGYARWHRRVCVGVHNLERTAAQYIVDRISGLALEVGLEPGEPGCEPHVNIVFSSDAAQTAARMVESEPRTFRPVGGHAGTDLGLDALDAFVATDKAVRWWHVSMPVDARTGAPAIETPNTSCPRPHCYPVFGVAGPSRIHSGVRDDLQYVIIVVDATRLTGTTWQQLGDYLAFISLAQVDPSTDPREFDSILNLFMSPAAYSGLTDWDRHYVHALYSFDQERVARIQGNEIVSRIAKRELVGTE